jgi:hypothetical protein
MARATFSSDLKLILVSILRRWDSSVMLSLVHSHQLQAEARIHRVVAPVPSNATMPVPMTTSEESFV